MQKFLAVSVFASTVALAQSATLYCKVTNTVASQTDACADATSLADKTIAHFTDDAEKAYKFVQVTTDETVCAEVTFADESDDASCLAAVVISGEVTVDERACLNGAAGAAAICGVAKDGTCSDTIFCQTGLECDATSKKCVAPTVDYIVTKFSQSNKGDLQTALNAVFKQSEAEPTVQHDGSHCEDMTVTIQENALFFPSSRYAFVTASVEIPAACITEVAENFTFKKVSDATEDELECKTVCGDHACLCEAGMQCTPEPAAVVIEHHDGDSSDCLDGLTCVADGDKYICSSSIIPSAALAVAAAVFAVIF